MSGDDTKTFQGWEMKHKHAELIKLKADGVLIERKVSNGWMEAEWCCFDWTYAEFRIAPNQPAEEKVKKWRWMFFYPAPIQPSSIYI